MLKKLKSSNGGGSIFPIMLTIIITTAFMVSIFLINLDTHLRNLQKDRYIKSVNMAVNTAMANIELSDNTAAMNSELNAQQESVGFSYEASSLDLLAAGYESHKRLIIDKEALMDTFYEVLLRNFQIKGVDKIESFQRYIPLKAILQYDTIAVSNGMHYDTSIDIVTGLPKNKYVDDWQEIRLSCKDPGTDTDIYMTIGDQCYIIEPSVMADTTTTITEKFQEENRRYFTPPKAPVPPDTDYTISYPPPPNAGTPVLDTTGNPIKLHFYTDDKNRELARCVERVLRSYANNQRANTRLAYQMSIAEFDNFLHDPNMTGKVNGSINAAKDVTFYCLVEGLPMKSLLTGKIDNSFSTFSYGGSALKRADE